MSYTNVKVPNRFCPTQRLFEEIALLKFKNERLEKKVDELISEIENIFQAVKEWGHVDLTCRGETIVLIEQSKPVEGVQSE